MRSILTRAAEPVDQPVVSAAAEAFADCQTLADLMRWCERQQPRAQVIEIVTQDEYTHDVVLPFDQAFLVFDTT
jgi:hypothetical protein